MSYNAGSAFVSVRPDMSSFQDDVKAELAAADAQFAEAGDKAGKSFGDAFSTQLRASFADLPTPKVTADADTAEADAQLDEAAKTRTATIKPTVDKTSLAQVKKDLSSVGDSAGKIKPPSLVTTGAFAATALGPQALGAAVGAAGIGVALVAAAADAGAFGAIAVPMFTKVTTAQAALTTAQAAYNKATTDAGRASALKAEQAALAGLTPAEKQLATELTGLTGAWSTLQKAEEPVVGAAIAPWLATATSGMQLLTPLIDEGSGAIQLLGQDAGEALQSPFWTTFSQTLGTTGQIALTAFGTAAGSLADGLAHLFVTFAPDIDSLLTDIPVLAGDFDTWAKGVKAGGLEDFFGKTFSHANLQTLKGDLTNVGSFFGTVATATSEISPLAFNGLSVLLEAIGSLPPDAVLALTALFLATKTIGAIGNIAGLANSVIGLGKSVIGLFSGAASTAEETAEGTAAGTAAGTSAATAFTSTFSAEVTAALPAVFTEIGATGATEAAAAGTAMGTGAATAFGVAFAAEDELGVTAALTAVGVSGAVEANVAGAAIGAAAAAGFAEGVGGVGATLGSVVATAGVVALVGAGLAGAALGAAVGLGFTTAFGATGAGNAVSGLETNVKNGAASASTWLTPAGQQAAQGFIAGFNSQAAAIQAAAAQAKAWSQAGTSGSPSTLTPAGLQTGQGFASGFTSAHNAVNSAAAQAKSWVTESIPSPASILVNAGISVAQGFANGIISASGYVISAAESIAGTVSNIISSALNINSPSKVMMPIGSAVPEGMAVGMLGGAGFITDAGSKLATITANSLGGIASAQSLGALSALGVPVIGSPARLPGVSSPLNSGPLQMQVSYASTGNALTDAVVGALRYDIGNNTGGDVQAHLGQGQVRTGG